MPQASRHRHTLAVALLGLGMLFSSIIPARAVIMTYTLTGHITGSLGANNFSDTPFTWTQTGDTSAQLLVAGAHPGIPAVTSSISIGILPLATPQDAFFIAFVDAIDAVLFTNYGETQFLVFTSAALNLYEFLAIGPINVNPFSSNSINTNQGLLTFATPTNLIFAATEAAIPEPASLALLATSLLGLDLRGRRR